jgi:hypothetical protein
VTFVRIFSKVAQFLFVIVFSEEVITKSTTELTTTRQIATRIKRQVLLEDGKIVDDSGPIIETNTTEDTDKKTSQETEVRGLKYIQKVKNCAEIHFQSVSNRSNTLAQDLVPKLKLKISSFHSSDEPLATMPIPSKKRCSPKI